VSLGGAATGPRREQLHRGAHAVV